jgi:hypothetical protein
MTDEALPEHVARNRAASDTYAADYAEPGRRNWETSEPRWGIWGMAESTLSSRSPI